jgi:hypothetical protein
MLYFDGADLGPRRFPTALWRCAFSTGFDQRACDYRTNRYLDAPGTAVVSHGSPIEDKPQQTLRDLAGSLA